MWVVIGVPLIGCFPFTFEYTYRYYYDSSNAYVRCRIFTCTSRTYTCIPQLYTMKYACRYSKYAMHHMHLHTMATRVCM